MQELEIAGQKIAFKVEGDQPSLCFLVHGFGGAPKDWQDVVSELKKHHTVITPHLTPLMIPRKISDKPLTFSIHAKLLEEFISAQKKHFELQHGRNLPAFAIGSSYGGALLWAGMVSDPQLLTAATLVSPMPPAPFYRLKNRTLKTFVGLAKYPKLLALYLSSPLGKMRLPFVESVFHVPWQRPEKMRRLAHLTDRKMKLITYVVHTFSWIVMHEDWPYWESRLDQIKTPIQILWGVDDHLFEEGENVRLQKSLPGSELKIIDNAGHLAMIEAPTDVVRESLAHFGKFLPLKDERPAT